MVNLEQLDSEVPLTKGALAVGVVFNLKKGLNPAVPDAEAEYDSIETVYAIKSALEAEGHHIILLEADEALPEKLRNEHIDIAFNIAEGLNGRGREAQIPAMLNFFGIPFTGSDETTLCLALDPLVMSTKRLEHIVSGLRAIPHVDIIRIGTRVPVVMPMRITTELLDMLKRYQPIWINTHFNHPNEITPDAQRACAAIADAGIPLGNQSVLLRGINDDPETMKELLLKLFHMRVRPYYLYQCDLSRGIAHFRTDVNAGIDIIHKLTGNVSGYAIPKYVIDAPHGGGKIPINYNYVLSKDDREVVMENYKGNIYKYPLPKMPGPV